MTVHSVFTGGQHLPTGNAAPSGRTHTVERGETLSQIARQHGVSLSALIAANPQILNPNLIYPDQTIHLPGGSGEPAAQATTAATDATYSGGPLSRVQLAQLFHQAGFRGENLVNMVAIAMRESGGDPRAYNGNTGTRDNSYGLTQINMIGNLGPARLQQFGLSSADQLFDPLTNARAAYALSGNGTDLSPWGGYKGMSNTYNTDIDAARAAVAQAEAQGALGQPFQGGAQTDGATTPATASPAAASTSSAASMPVLRIGARGEAVAELQRELQAAGFSPGPVDGWFGPQTQAAVRAFQQSRGITVDGWVGPQTWGQLLSTGGAAPLDGRLVQGASGAQVRELQQMLQSLGYYGGNIGGNFGPLTDAAVRNFQRDHGLTVDGWAGPQTMGALRQAVQGGGTPPVTTPPVGGAPNADVQAALAFGLDQLGAPYVGGGSPYRFGTPGDGGMHQMDGQLKYRSPAGVIGFDCSGLVVAMFRQAGIDLNAMGIANTRSMQARLDGVAKGDLQPGDLLVKGGSHVVIYLGDTNGDGRAEVLEATSDGDGNGDGIGSGDVRISDAAGFLNNPAYVGRRVPPAWYT